VRAHLTALDQPAQPPITPNGTARRCCRGR
jgi:hypothetical protein